jgi:proteasome accessory factor A
MPLPKYIARDAELLTAGADPEGQPMAPWEATRRLLARVDAAFERYGARVWSQHARGPHDAHWSSSGWGSPMSIDCLRTWAPNGQCFYSDMAHWEGCTAETLSAREYAAQCLSTLVVADRARQRAQDDAEPGTRFTLSAHNVDAHDPGISWGTHLNVSVSEDLWEDLLLDWRHPARLGFVASGLAAAVAWFGAGYLMPLRDGTTVFSLSARAHHLGRVVSTATTTAFERGLLHTRREPHGDGMDRLHLIGFDFQLASAALSAVFVQCLLAAAEEGYCGPILYDPVRAQHVWSWRLDLASGLLPATSLVIDGRTVTLPQYIRELAEAFLQMVEGGLIPDAAVPDAARLLPIVIDTTHYAEEGSLEKLARHSDWAAQLLTLLSLCEEPGVRLGDAVTILANQDYASVDPDRGTFWRLWREDLVDPMVTLEDVERCLQDGPEKTRAWARGRIVREFGPWIAGMDWGYILLRRDDSCWGPRLRIEMPDLDSLNRTRFESVLRAARSVDDLDRLLREQAQSATSESDPLMEIACELPSKPEAP